MGILASAHLCLPMFRLYGHTRLLVRLSLAQDGVTELALVMGRLWNDFAHIYIVLLDGPRRCDQPITVMYCQVHLFCMECGQKRNWNHFSGKLHTISHFSVKLHTINHFSGKPHTINHFSVKLHTIGHFSGKLHIISHFSGKLHTMSLHWQATYYQLLQ